MNYDKIRTGIPCLVVFKQETNSFIVINNYKIPAKYISYVSIYKALLAMTQILPFGTLISIRLVKGGCSVYSSKLGYHWGYGLH